MDDDDKITQTQVNATNKHVQNTDSNLNNVSKQISNTFSYDSPFEGETGIGTTFLPQNSNENVQSLGSLLPPPNSESNQDQSEPLSQTELPNPQRQNSSSTFNQSINSNSNEKSPKTPSNHFARPLRPSTSSPAASNKIPLRVITTIDTTKPPSGYSDYSYSYEYSEDDENGETTHSKKVKTSTKKKPRYVLNISEEEFRQLKIKAVNCEPLENLDDDVYEALITSIGRDRKRSALQEDFEQGNRLTAAIDHITECQLEQKKYLLQQQKYDEYAKNMTEVLQQLKEFDEQTAQEEEKIRAKEREQIRALEMKHRETIDKHEKEWSNGYKTKQYNHASTRLLFLRKQYQQLVQQCRFKEATNVKTEINSLEKKEGVEAMKLMQEHYDASLKKVQQKHNEEIRSLHQRYESMITKLRARRATERIPFQSKETKWKKIEEIINDPDKLWSYTQEKRLQDDVKSRSSGRLPKASARIQPKEISLKHETKIKLPALNTKKSK